MEIEGRINHLQSENERKIGKEELGHIRSEIGVELDNIRKLIEQKEKAEKMKKLKYAAGAIPVNCVSCSVPSMQKQHPYQNLGDRENVYAALEQKLPLPGYRTIGPYKSYELDTLRKLGKGGTKVFDAIANKVRSPKYKPEVLNRKYLGSPTKST